MGCDWYNFVSVSGVGFTVSGDQYESFKNLLGSEYGGFIYGEPTRDENTVQTYLFIYDKETVTYDEISTPGPYEIRTEDNATQIQEHKHMAKFFHDKIMIMKEHFDLQDGMCSYWSLLTTIRIGEFELYLRKDDYSHAFSSVTEYCEYHGFSEEEDSKEETESDD